MICHNNPPAQVGGGLAIPDFAMQSMMPAPLTLCRTLIPLVIRAVA